jgi:hypothetical protein
MGLRLHKGMESRGKLLTVTVTWSKSRPTSARPEHRPREHGHPKCRSRVNAQHFRRASMQCMSASRRRPDAHNARVVRCRAVRLRVVYESRCRAAKSSGIPSAPRRAAELGLFDCVLDHRTWDGQTMIGKGERAG